MARRLQDQKRSEYECHAKACPRPADFARFPELMREVRLEWQRRLAYCRGGKKRAKQGKRKKG